MGTLQGFKSFSRGYIGTVGFRVCGLGVTRVADQP